MKFLNFRRGSTAPPPKPLQSQEKLQSIYTPNCLLGLPLELREQIWGELLPQKALIICPCIGDIFSYPSSTTSNWGNCEPCSEHYVQLREARSRNSSRVFAPRTPPTNFDPVVLRINQSTRHEILTLLDNSNVLDTYYTCMQACMKLLLLSLPLDRKASIHQLRLWQSEATIPLRRSLRLEVFEGMNLPPDTSLLALETKTYTTKSSATSWRTVQTDLFFHWRIPEGVSAKKSLEKEILRGIEEEQRRRKQDKLVNRDTEDRWRHRLSNGLFGMGTVGRRAN